MPKNPLDHLKDFHKDKIVRNRKIIEYIHTQTDSLVTWVIGFSFTGLLLISANTDKIKQKEPTWSIILFLFIAIVFGIAFRFMSYKMTLLHQRLDDYYYGRFPEIPVMPFINVHDLDSMNYDELVDLIKDDFGKVTDETPTDEQKIERTPKLREIYLEFVAVSKSMYDLGIETIIDIDHDVYRIDKKKALAKYNKQMRRKRIGFNIRSWTKAKNILYYTSVGSFLVAVSILCFALLIWFS
ncbi:MAG: hypothetical protein WDO19_30815 [Bacteroidota bacterium]